MITMATIILGGAPGANWTPLLLPVLAVLMLLVSVEYLVKLIKRKLYHKSHTGIGSNEGIDGAGAQANNKG